MVTSNTSLIHNLERKVSKIYNRAEEARYSDSEKNSSGNYANRIHDPKFQNDLGNDVKLAVISQRR
jgi:hypothetical protein